MWNKLKGKKTYLLAWVGVIYFLSAAMTGHITWKEAIDGIWNAGLAMTIRHGIS